MSFLKSFFVFTIPPGAASQKSTMYDFPLSPLKEIQPLVSKPRSQLPENILFCIFLHLKSLSLRSQDWRKRGTDQPTAVILSQVCSSWRTVALKSPTLWSRIHVFFPIHNYPNPYLAREWVKRAGNGGLDLTISDNNSPEIHSHRYAIQILNLLLPTCTALALHLPRSHDVANLILSYIETIGSNPRITLLSGGSEWSDRKNLPESLSLRKRQVFSLPNTYPSSHPPHQNAISWRWNTFDTPRATFFSRDILLLGSRLCNHITKMHLFEPIDPSTLLAVAKSLLECGELHVWNLEEPINGGTTLDAQLTIPKLYSLSLSGTSNGIGYFIRRLYLPKLQALRLEYLGREALIKNSEPFIIDQLLIRSNCRLSNLNLTFQRGIINDSALVDFLTPKSLRSLSKLSLTAKITKGVVDLLSLKPSALGEPTFMPKLTELRLQVCTSVPDKHLYRMVSLRRPQTRRYTTLQHVEITIDACDRLRHASDDKDFLNAFKNGLKGYFRVNGGT